MPFIVAYNAQFSEENGRFYFLKRDNPDADLFGFDAHLIRCDAMMVFFEGKATAQGGKKVGAAADGFVRYGYEVDNTGSEIGPIQQFFLELAAPIEWATVTAPPGWSFEPWDANVTPDIMAPPPYLPPPERIDDDPLMLSYHSTVRGILWYTLDPQRAIQPGQIEDHFGFEARERYAEREFALTAGVSNGVTAWIDPQTEGLISEFHSVNGPVAELEPCAADLNEDGRVDQADLALLLSCYADSPCSDVDGDGITDSTDLALLLAAYGTTCPEAALRPGSAAQVLSLVLD